MIKAEIFFKDFTNADSAVISATSEENSSGVTEKISAVPDVSISSAVSAVNGTYLLISCK